MNVNKKKTEINAWCMYDWAISAFHTTVMAAFIPIFFRNVAVVSLPAVKHHLATAIWGYTAAAAMLIMAVLTLILGPLADYTESKKRFLGIFTALGAIFTAALALTGPGDWIWVSLLFIVANVGAAGSEVFYESLLPHIAEPQDIHRISARGYAMGYIGGAILLAVNIGMIWMLPQSLINSESVPLLGMRLSFLSVAVWWAAFSIPLFLKVPESDGPQKRNLDSNPLMISLSRLPNTFREIRRYKHIFLFILAFWFYNDGIGTIMKMATAYGDEIGIGTLDLIGALFLTQIIGIPMAFAFGRMAEHIGSKRSVLIGIGVYIFICIGGYFMQTAVHFWILAGMVGLVQGGTQAISRSIYGSIIPKKKSAEFFTFYTISGKFAGVAGPTLFALTSQLAGTSRLGILSLILFFLIGGGILIAVDINGNRYKAASQ